MWRLFFQLLRRPGEFCTVTRPIGGSETKFQIETLYFYFDQEKGCPSGQYPWDLESIWSMDWILTHTGTKFHPLSPNPQNIHIEDIAHSLSLQCRFNGHSHQFYSVAEHSVRLSNIVEPDVALWGLLHDAGEAYFSDLPRPIKNQFPRFRELEDALVAIIMQKYGLPPEMPPVVKKADDIMLITELRDIMPKSPVPIEMDVQPLEEIIVPWSAEDAKRRFLERFEMLINN